MHNKCMHVFMRTHTYAFSASLSLSEIKAHMSLQNCCLLLSFTHVLCTQSCGWLTTRRWDVVDHWMHTVGVSSVTAASHPNVIGPGILTLASA